MHLTCDSAISFQGIYPGEVKYRSTQTLEYFIFIVKPGNNAKVFQQVNRHTNGDIFLY